MLACVCMSVADPDFVSAVSLILSLRSNRRRRAQREKKTGEDES